MNGSKSLCDDFIRDLNPSKDLKIIICPPYPYIDYMIRELNGNFVIGAQDCSQFKDGAYTGDVSARMLKECDVKYVIIGHSERNESSDIILHKVSRCLENNITPIVCVSNSDIDYLKNFIPQEIIIAYEPLTAIGTGIAQSNEEIETIVKQIKLYGHYKVIYGGSVTHQNASKLLQLKDLDGLLVGKASLSVQGFNAIL